MTLSDLLDLMLAIAVERRPLDFLAALRRPVKVDFLSVVSDEQVAAFE